MTEPSLSELYAKLASLRARVERLQPGGGLQDSPAPTDGTVISAGTIFYCRPSHFREFVERFGGERNVEIMDTTETSGFACGKYKTAAPWTNAVYPTDIGPSCDGIDSNTKRVNVSPINDNIIRTTWDPSKLFLSRSYVGSFPFDCSATMIKRFLLIHGSPWSSDEYDALVPHDIIKWGQLIPPSTTMSAFPSGAFFSTEKTIILTTDKKAAWSGNSTTSINYVGDFDTLRQMCNNTFNVFNTSFVLFGDYDACMVKMSSGPEVNNNNDSILLVPQSAPSVPYKIPFFRINSQTLEQFTPTPILRYGGYRREGHNFTGPTPRWNRTNVLQIKILRDVRINVESASTS